ncbi:DUF2304 family protein [Allostreptomyces psammosilenae]|uniref:Uncharacterized protein n=1 Tax=Allostreptomyces psammosilenae TaxID=1892865 RepID=A0A853A1Q8_9ACTN|nr:DUF2304 family protein [Allostreptomyces psammosilenae]NYI08077.1 hypothetical protein [Allostreptomyces psammosilenae]
MALSISVVLLLTVITVILIRRSGLNVWHALVCVLLGFYLAGSSIAPSISTFTDNVAGMLSGIDF